MAVNETNIQASQPLQVKPQNVTASSSANTTASATEAESKQLLSTESKEVVEAQEARQDEVKSEVAELNDYMQNLNRSLKFSVDENSGSTVVQVIDADTDELLRQIPAQELLDIKNATNKYLGIIFEAKA